MRWKQKIPALPKPKMSSGKPLAVLALAAVAFVVGARALGADDALVRMVAIGALGLLGLAVVAGVKHVADKAKPLQWITLAVVSGVNVWVATKPSGINIARVVAVEALILLMWVQWLLPTSKFLRRVMVVAPLPALLAGFMIGSAEPPANARTALDAVNLMVKEQVPGATADMFGGLGASLGDLIHWLIAPIAGLFS